jgi:hypothetical protein
MTEKELKFHADLSTLIQRAFRAGATLDSVQMVMDKVQSDLASFEPYLKAMNEKDLGP